LADKEWGAIQVLVNNDNICYNMFILLNIGYNIVVKRMTRGRLLYLKTRGRFSCHDDFKLAHNNTNEVINYAKKRKTKK